ncbi:MAG: choice-of-anchor Q domain-containing protein [Akkermansiaceae bacterium]
MPKYITRFCCGAIALSSPMLNAALTEMVTTAEDQNNGATGGRSLREAIADVDDGGTIRFSKNISMVPIRLTLGPLSHSGKMVTIDASEHPFLVTIDAAGQSRVYNIAGLNSDLDLKGIKITGGSGGGVVFTSNLSRVRVENCWFVGNEGPALRSRGGLVVNGCTFSDNTNTQGGAVVCFGTPGTVTNSTFYRNSGTSFAGGGAIYTATSLAITHCTFHQNRRPPNVIGTPQPGAAVGVEAGTATLRGCVFSRNDGATQFNAAGSGSIVSGGYNLIDTGDEGILTEPSDIDNTPASLRPFDFHLGKTPTLPPAEGSPLLDVIPNPSPFPSPTSTDQRGFNRLQNALYDIGAVEAFPLVSIGADATALQNTIDNAGAEVRIKFNAASSGQTITLPNQTELLMDTGSVILDASHLDEPVTITGTNSRLLRIESVHAQLRKLIFVGGNSIQTTTGAVGQGGAIYIGEDSEEFVSIIDCQFASNRATSGGGIAVDGGSSVLEIRRSSFLTGQADSAGALYSVGSTVLIENSTFRSNSAGGTTGSAIHVTGRTSLSHSTIAGNFTTGLSTQGAVYATSSLYFTHCLWQSNANGALTVTTAHNGGFNLSDDNPSLFGADDISNADVSLSSLDYYGGCVQTVLPAAGSAAIDAGRAGEFLCLLGDTRGFQRVRGGRIDIGAVEAHSDYFCDFDTWALENLPLVDRQPDSDTDNDGMNAITEWALGLDPTTHNHPVISIAPDRKVVFEWNPSAKDITLIVQLSTDLVGWSDFYTITNGSVTTGAGGPATVTNHGPTRQTVERDAPNSTSGKRFIRFKVIE